MPPPFLQAVFRCPQGKHMPGPRQIFRFRVRINQGFCRLKPVMDAFSCCRVLFCIDGNRKGGSEPVGAVLNHQGNFQCIKPSSGHRNAHDAACFFDHEVKFFSRCFSCCKNKVALVFPLPIVNKNNKIPFLKLFNSCCNGGEYHWKTYLSFPFFGETPISAFIRRLNARTVTGFEILLSKKSSTKASREGLGSSANRAYSLLTFSIITEYFNPPKSASR